MQQIQNVFKLASFCILLFCVQCHRTGSIDVKEKYMELAHAGHDYLNKSEFELNPTFLDSALMCFNEAEQLCPNKKNVMSYNKSFVYFEKKDYDNAIKMIELSADSIFVYPEYKTVLIEKLRAKKAEDQADRLTQQKHYRNIVANFDHFLETYRIAADSIMHLPDGDYVGSTLYGMNLAECYYYKAKLMGKQKTLLALDSLQRSTGYNQDFINWVKDVVSEDKGKSIQVIFE